MLKYLRILVIVMGVVSLVFLFGFGSLVIFFFLVGWFWDFWISLGLGVGVKIALGRDDTQIRRNVFFMIFWYAVLQFKVSDPG